MMPSAPQGAWRLTGQAAGMAGFAYGSRYPSIRITIVGDQAGSEVLAKVAALLATALGQGDAAAAQPWASTAGQSGFEAAVTLTLGALHRMMRAADLPVHEPGWSVPIETGRAWVFVPTFTRSFDAVANALAWVVRLLDLTTQARETGEHLQNLPKAIERLRRTGLRGSNTARFVSAAFERGLPLQELPGQVMQYGQACRSRWMDSSFTDETSQLAAGLARDKRYAATMLRQAGIPVPRHRAADSADAALQVAHQLGYPVVIKPADLDGGVGVAAGLQSADEVRRAYGEARRHSASVLVEKHVEGRDYRLVVLHGELIWAIERVPAGVTGDGRHTVRELVERVNADPRRADRPGAALKRLLLDREALALLRRDGVSETSVPAEGQFVRLRRAANVAVGGTPVPVFDRVHPDNRRLAVRATEALRLDLAGVDLLMPDIGRSWKEVGAAICEVNGQPNLGQTTSAHLYGQILRALVPGDGRIPVAVVLGAGPESTLARDIEARLLAAGIAAGCSDREGVRINGEAVSTGPLGTYAGGLLLMRDRTVAAAVLSIYDSGVLQTGLPFARFDVLALAGPHVSMRAPGARSARPATTSELVNVLLPAVLPGCDGKVLPAAGAGWSLPELPRRTSAAWASEPVAPGRLADAVVEALLEAEARHAASQVHAT
jgi:cyanophycin synthetase